MKRWGRQNFALGERYFKNLGPPLPTSEDKEKETGSFDTTEGTTAQKFIGWDRHTESSILLDRSSCWVSQVRAYFPSVPHSRAESVNITVWY